MGIISAPPNENRYRVSNYISHLIYLKHKVIMRKNKGKC